MVPHDVEGLTALMGGPDAMAAKLDSLFATPRQYDHASVQCLHIAHLYNYAGRSRRTQELVDSLLRTGYHGKFAAWHVLNALGFYQVCPGKPVYSIGRPLIDRDTLHLANGKDFVIEVHGNSPENRYISRIALNGKPLTEPFFDHDAIMGGGTLEIYMSSVPAKN